METEKEGPTIKIIPVIEVTTCSGCKYYEFGLIKSGTYPILRHSCLHESAPNKLSMYGNIGDLTKNNYIITPLWCPFLINESKRSENTI